MFRTLLLSILVSSTSATFAQKGIQFDGLNDYVTFGTASGLGSSAFTIEIWFKRTGTGATTSTGTGGVTAYPLLAKGRSESDGSTKDMNYFLGINTSGKLVADFEEGAGQATPGLNHPVTGITTIVNNTWYHAAATYDGASWNLYLNGNLEKTLAVGRLPQSASIQHASIGSALNSTGSSSGNFKGVLDEARVWNYARTQAQISASRSAEITATTGLVGYWKMNEGTGTTAANTGSASSANGSLRNGPTWVTGFPAGTPPPVNNPPIVTIVAPANNVTGVSTNATLSVSVSDAQATALTVTFYARACPAVSTGVDFTIVPLPDTQYYTSHMNGGTNSIYKAQMQWVVNNRVSQNIVFVEGLGDCVQNGDNGGNPIEWLRADTSMKIIENPITTTLAHGIPYGINVGNHDQTPGGSSSGSTNSFNTYFGEARFSGRDYYGGHYGNNNDNSYYLFSASGLNFIVINFEYATSMSSAVLTWADNLLKTHSNRRGIVGSHYILNSSGTFGTQGQAIYNALRNNPNLFLMLCGHNDEEAQRQDTYIGNTVYSVMSDYQARTKGGNGWLRMMKFSPANNTISVKTYSPTLNQYETDANSQFTLNYNMSPPPAAFASLGTNSNVASGTTTTKSYSALLPNTCYEWYVIVSDGVNSITSSSWKFTTGSSSNKTTLNEAEEDELQIKVYPNPSSTGIFNVKYDNLTSETTYSVINAAGQEIHAGEFSGNGGLKQLDLANAAKGIYFFIINSATEQKVERIIVE